MVAIPAVVLLRCARDRRSLPGRIETGEKGRLTSLGRRSAASAQAVLIPVFVEVWHSCHNAEKAKQRRTNKQGPSFLSVSSMIQALSPDQASGELRLTRAPDRLTATRFWMHFHS